MLVTVAIDDEPIALEVIKSLSAKIPFIELKATFTNALEAVALLRKEKIDLLLLDIKMPDISGIDLLKSISHPPMVIFTTAHSEHAVQSFELDAIDYLLKPFSLSRYLKACNKAEEQYQFRNSSKNNDSSCIFIKNGYDELRVEVEEILYAESKGNYLEFILQDNKSITSRLTMQEAEALLPSSLFVRIHRSYIVAKKQVSKVQKNMVWINEVPLPVGANYVDALEKIKHLPRRL